MDLNAFTTLIGSLGFPIVMCLLLYYRMDKQDENRKTEIEKITFNDFYLCEAING